MRSRRGLKAREKACVCLHRLERANRVQVGGDKVVPVKDRWEVMMPNVGLRT